MASEDEVVIDLRKMKIPELKKELQLRSLKTTGNKQDLIERLQQYLEEHEGAEVADDEILKEDDGEDQLLTDDKKLEDTTDDSVLSVQAEELKPKAATKKPEVKVEEKAVEQPATEKTHEVKDLHSPTGLTDKQKLEIRAKKFGMTVVDMNTDARKAARSERFGTGSVGDSAPAVEPDKLKKRAERFGGIVSPTLSKTEEEDRRRKRQARFGGGAASGVLSGDVDEKKRKRAERFGMSVA